MKIVFKGPLIYYRWGGGGGEGWCMGVRVIKFYVTKKGSVTKNLTWALGRRSFVNIAAHLK